MYEGLAIDTEGDPNAINVRNFCSTCTPSVDQVCAPWASVWLGSSETGLSFFHFSLCERVFSDQVRASDLETGLALLSSPSL